MGERDVYAHNGTQLHTPPVCITSTTQATRSTKPCATHNHNSFDKHIYILYSRSQRRQIHIVRHSITGVAYHLIHICFCIYWQYTIIIICFCYIVTGTSTHTILFFYTVPLYFFFSTNEWCCNIWFLCYFKFLMATPHLCYILHHKYITQLLHQQCKFWQVAVTFFNMLFFFHLCYSMFYLQR